MRGGGTLLLVMGMWLLSLASAFGQDTLPEAAPTFSPAAVHVDPALGNVTISRQEYQRLLELSKQQAPQQQVQAHDVEQDDSDAQAEPMTTLIVDQSGNIIGQVPMADNPRPQAGDGPIPKAWLRDDKALTTTNVEPPVPFGWYPTGAGFGGFPPVPPFVNDPSTFRDGVLQQLQVRMRSGGIMRLYGFARGDWDIATAVFNDIQNPFFVLPRDVDFRVNGQPVQTNTTNYSIYPRLTRVGLEYYGLPIETLDDAVPAARVEIDFLTAGGGGAPLNVESRQLLRLRLAYAEITHGDWTVLAGQDWDIAAPLVPSINDNTLQWNNGNIGDRRPQFKLLYDHKFDNEVHLMIQNGAAMADAINGADRDGDGIRDNEFSGLPAYEGLLGFVAPSWVENKKVLGGVWSLVGANHTSVPIGNHKWYTMWGCGLYYHIPLTKMFMLRGETFQGQDLDDFRGGIAQGINPVRGVGIETRGGWYEVVFQPCKWYENSFGYSFDNPTNIDVPVGGRTLNESFYIGTRFLFGHGFVVGMDVQDWKTKWQGFNEGRAVLVKTFMQLNF